MTSLQPWTAARLEQRLARAQTEGRLPTLVAGVIRDGELAWSGGRGQLPGGERPDDDVQYRIGSITKTFTAALVLRLRDEGRLRLGDRLDRHLPGSPLGDRTLRDLLSHRAGLQAETDGPWWERTAVAAWGELAFGPDAVRHEAGRRFHYSNVGYGALGEVVARLRDAPWGDAVRDELLEPLGMRRTTLRPAPPAAPGLAVHPWADLVLPEPEHDAGGLAPAGQLWSTVADLARFAAVLTGDGGQVLTRDTVAEMREPAAVEDGPDGLEGYGLGLQVWRWRDRTVVGHGGSMPGFVAGLEADPTTGDAVVVFANSTAGRVRVLGTDLLGIVVDHEPHPPPEWVPATVDERVVELLGPWYWGPTPLVVRGGRDGELHLEAFAGQGRASRFRPRADGTWEGLEGYYAGEVLRVGRDAAGTVTHLDIASFILTRTPYDQTAPIPGGVDRAGWVGPPRPHPS